MLHFKRGTIIGVLLFCVFAFGAVTVVNLATQVTGLLGKTNGGTGISSTATFPSSGTVSTTFATGTTALGTSAIASGSCGTTVSVSTSGIVTTDVIEFSLSAAPSSSNLYSWLTVYSFPTSGAVNFSDCNPSSASRTPTALSAVWRVTR